MRIVYWLLELNDTLLVAVAIVFVVIVIVIIVVVVVNRQPVHVYGDRP